MLERTSSAPPPLHSEQAAAPGLRFPGKHNQERGGQLLCPGHRRKKTPSDQAMETVKFNSLFCLYFPITTAVFLKQQCRPVNLYTINTGGASNINFKRVKNK